jgi:hypothetical protein
MDKSFSTDPIAEWIEAEGRRRGGNPAMSAFVLDLGLPEGMFDRSGDEGNEYQRAISWLTEKRPREQNHWPALTIALIAQAEEGLAVLGVDSQPEVLTSLSREEAPLGRPVNTLNLIVGSDGEVTRLRPKYNLALQVIHVELQRFGHPSNPGHATQSWPQYSELIKEIWAASPSDRVRIAEWVWANGVLSLAESTPSAYISRRVSRYSRLLSDMPTEGRPGGAIWQGVCFGYLAADSPNLVLESHKANTGSSRSGLLGDVDGFVGHEIALAVECKDRHLTAINWRSELSPFAHAMVDYPGTLGLVMVRSAEPDVVNEVGALGLTVITRDQMQRTAAVWDEPKQRLALQGLLYFLRRVQKSEVLLEQVLAWCSEAGLIQSENESDE